MLSLAESQKNGPLSLELLDLLGALVTEAEEESGEKEIAEPLGSLTLEDSPPPLPNLDEVFDGVEHSIESDESISELSSLTGDYQSAFDHKRRLKIRAQALSSWLRPSDPVTAVQAWEILQAQFGADDESTYALVKLYSELGKRRELIKLLSFVEGEAELVQRRRHSIILAAAQLETRFQEFTEAFKCWLALYEHSPQDREICISAFYRLSSKDKDLSPLLTELLKLRSEHSKSMILSISSALEFSHCSNGSLFEQEIAYKVLKGIIFSKDYTDEALNLFLKLTQILGLWKETVQTLAQSTKWRLLWLAAHISECRLGEHKGACILYEAALDHLESSYRDRTPFEQECRIFFRLKANDSRKFATSK